MMLTTYIPLLLSLLAVALASRASWLASKSRMNRAVFELKAQVTLLSDGIDSVHAMLRKLQMRDHARKIAAERGRSNDSEPDPYKDPEGWKSYMSRKMRNNRNVEQA